MDLEARIRKLTNAVKYCKPDKCEGCKFCDGISDGEYTEYFCNLIEGSYEACINYEISEGKVSCNCPLLDPLEDPDDYNEIVEQLKLLVELKAARIKLQEIKLQEIEVIKGGRYNGKRALAILGEIERIAREAFSNPDTLDINLYRAQALAKIFQIFEYNGATIGEAKEEIKDPEVDKDQLTFDDILKEDIN